ncbi:FecR family protein [Larkinella harenae]
MRHFFTKGFLALLTRFRTGKSTSQEQSMIDIWYDSLDDPETDTLPRRENSQEQVWKRIIDRIDKVDPVTQPSVFRFRKTFVYAAAAVLLLMMGLTVYLMEWPSGTTPVSNRSISSDVLEINRSDKPRSITLPDGSRVVLEPAATLRYPASFNTTLRTVDLTGNASFSVTKNPAVPFMVKTDVITTRVLGTEFTITSDPVSGETEVEVHTGKVQVNVVTTTSTAPPLPHQSVFLTANLKATFQPLKKELVTSLATDSKPIGPQAVTAATFVFNDSPLRGVLKRLEETYGVPIQVDEPDMLNCPITADLSNEPLPVQLEMIVTALSARYFVSQDGVMIKGGSCRSSARP